MDMLGYIVLYLNEDGVPYLHHHKLQGAVLEGARLRAARTPADAVVFNWPSHGWALARVKPVGPFDVVENGWEASTMAVDGFEVVVADSNALWQLFRVWANRVGCDLATFVYHEQIGVASSYSVDEMIERRLPLVGLILKPTMNLDGATMIRCPLRGDWQGYTFQNASFFDCSFEDADLRQAAFAGCKLKMTSFRRTKLDTSFTSCQIATTRIEQSAGKVSFHTTEAEGLSLLTSSFEHLQVACSNLREVTVAMAEAQTLSVEQSVVRNLTVRSTQAEHVSLERATIMPASLCASSFDKVVIERCRLTDIDKTAIRLVSAPTVIRSVLREVKEADDGCR